MKFIRGELQHLSAQLPDLLEQISDENLEDAWRLLQQLYYDLYILKAIQESKRTFQPGDTLTQEEALRFLQFF